MNSLPKRDNLIYTDIEKFEDYEFTTCIAYELAIRNDDNIENICRFIYECIDKKENYKVIESKYKDIIVDAGFAGKLYLEYPFFRDLNEYIEKNTDWKQNNKKIGWTGIANPLYIISRNYEEKYFTDNKDKKYYLSILSSRYFHYHLNREKDYILNRKVTKVSRATPLYQRPSLELNFLENKHVDIRLNLALPIEELKEIMIKMKNDFNNNQSIKTPLEIINKKLNKYILPSKYPSNKENRNKAFTIKEKWADWFFINDFYKFADKMKCFKTKSEIYKFIDDELLKYHDNGGVENDGILDYWKSEATYRKDIIPTMKNLIEERGYKGLL